MRLTAAEMKLDLSFVPQSISAANDIPLEEGSSTRITRDSVSAKSECAFFPECSLQMENDSIV